jgi:hypothetical protein
MSSTVHPVDEDLPTGKLTALGFQQVLLRYAGAVAVPLIVGRAPKLSPEQVAAHRSRRPLALQTKHPPQQLRRCGGCFFVRVGNRLNSSARPSRPGLTGGRTAAHRRRHPNQR